MINCKGVTNAFEVTVYETSESGNTLKNINQFSTTENKAVISINPNERRITLNIYLEFCFVLRQRQLFTILNYYKILKVDSEFFIRKEY